MRQYHKEQAKKEEEKANKSVCMKKTNKWIKGVQNSALTRKETYVSLMSAVLKTKTYSFPATSLNERELIHIASAAGQLV